MNTICLKIAYDVLAAAFHFLLRIASLFVPIQNNKIVASAYFGRQYSDNTKYIVEELRRMDPELEIVWMKREGYAYTLPEGIRSVIFSKKNMWRVCKEYLTAKVWLDSQQVSFLTWKRKGQLYLETWHGGLGIKRIDSDSILFKRNPFFTKLDRHMAKNADLFIANCDHIERCYRSAFGYQGPVWKTGYPKNDILLREDLHPEVRKKVMKALQLPQEAHLAIVAPTFRDGDRTNVERAKKTLHFDLQELRKKLQQKWVGDWRILVRLHPAMTLSAASVYPLDAHMQDVSDYPNMQELIIASDVLITDYSSAIFDAGLMQKPSFILAQDYDEYKSARGVYYEMDELPFSWADGQTGLFENIDHFDQNAYRQKWETFAGEQGLFESGHAAQDIAEAILRFCKGDDAVFVKAMKQL